MKEIDELNLPEDLSYAEDHEWILRDGDTVKIGISDYAQDQLGDMVFIELPEVGQTVAAAEACAVVESVKAASDVYAPVGGEIVEVNEALVDSPETVNQDTYGEGWLFRLQPADVSEMAPLMDAEAYEDFLASEAH